MSLLAFLPTPATSDPFSQMEGPRGWCKSPGVAPAGSLTLETWSSGSWSWWGLTPPGSEVVWPQLSASLAAVTKVGAPSNWGPVWPLRRACPSVLKGVCFSGGLQMVLAELHRALALLLLPPPLLGHLPLGSHRLHRAGFSPGWRMSCCVSRSCFCGRMDAIWLPDLSAFTLA